MTTNKEERQRKKGLKRLARARKHLAKRSHSGGGHWTNNADRIAYAVLSDTMRLFRRESPRDASANTSQRHSGEQPR